MFDRVLDWLRDLRAAWDELGRIEATAKPPVSVTYYGSLGEMGHEDDRAHDWPEADNRGERS